MIGVDKMGDMRRRARGGEPTASIARAVGISEPTARKYARMEGLPPEPPKREEPESELPAPHRETTGSWPGDGCRNWRRQRHAAVRVYARLIDERGCEGSHPAAQRCVRRRREEMARERGRRDAEGFLQLSWLPGEIQAGVGAAGFRVRAAATGGRCLAVTFPRSDVGLAQAFWGETAECVCQGLRSVSGFAGGVPGRAVSGSATEVGRRVGETVRVSELFRRFAAHCGPGCAFASPYPGSEKGSVENEAGCHRRNLSVPVPSFHGVASLSERLLRDCPGPSGGRRRCRLGTPEPGLFGEDRQGTFTLGGVHRCSAGPACARCEVAVALGPPASRPAASPPARPSAPAAGSGAGRRPAAPARRCS